MRADVSNASATDGDPAAATNQVEFTVLFSGLADAALTRSSLKTNDISGLRAFACVAAAASSGEQMTGRCMMSHLDDNAATGSLIKASSRAPVASA